MDARGHVNNTIYYRYFECSRILLFRILNIYEKPTEVCVGPILSFQSCFYKAPLTYTDTITVGAKIVSIEGSKIIIKHVIVSEKLYRKVAEGKKNNKQKIF
ncbi:MAG: acyl-CoA thioesterase [Promethearchaeota archaeon]